MSDKKKSAQEAKDEERAKLLDEAKRVTAEQDARSRGIHPLSGTDLEDQQELGSATGKKKEKLAEEQKAALDAGLGAEVKGDDAPKSQVIEPEGTIKGMFIGASVLFYRKDTMSSGMTKLRGQPAIIVDMADKVSNFQPKDGAANLTVFTSHGGAVETRHNVMYSKEPMENRWSFNPNL